MIFNIVYYCIMVNLSSGTFNMAPPGGLDGSPGPAIVCWFASNVYMFFLGKIDDQMKNRMWFDLLLHLLVFVKRLYKIVSLRLVTSHLLPVSCLGTETVGNWNNYDPAKRGKTKHKTFMMSGSFSWFRFRKSFSQQHTDDQH